jgi:hypothetical protein
MLLGMLLLYVGAVLFCNGMWVMGRIEDREISVINVFVGGITLLGALWLAFAPANVSEAGSYRGAAFTLLFTFTYLWVAWNRWNGADGRGLGWFCFFVGITVIPIFLDAFASAVTLWDWWFAICWLSWSILWLLFWALLALQRTEIAYFTGALCSIQGIYTGWIPGFLLLMEWMPGQAAAGGG